MFGARGKRPGRAVAAAFKALALAAALGGAAAPARADSWRLPEKRKYYSANKRFAFEVTPKKLESQLEYFSDKAEGRPNAGARPKANPCRGVLLERRRDGSYSRRAAFALVNEVSPVSALVADSGRYVVTFDNWHAVGYGPDAVVIYRGDGTLVGKLGLEDFLTANDIETLPHSVSSIWWGGKHYLDEQAEHLVLRVVADGRAHQEDGAYHELRIALATGQPVEPKRELFARLHRKMFPSGVTVTADGADAEAGPPTQGEPSCLPGGGAAGVERVAAAELLTRAAERVLPNYPPIARAAQVRGRVLVEVLVDESGGVACARAVEGHPLLRQAAERAARSWKFRPGAAGGRQFGRFAFEFGALPPEDDKE